MLTLGFVYERFGITCAGLYSGSDDAVDVRSRSAMLALESAQPGTPTMSRDSNLPAWRQSRLNLDQQHALRPFVTCRCSLVAGRGDLKPLQRNFPFRALTPLVVASVSLPHSPTVSEHLNHSASSRNCCRLEHVLCIQVESVPPAGLHGAIMCSSWQTRLCS
jgi:hypothetical protein